MADVTTTLNKIRKFFGVELEAAANTAETIAADDGFRPNEPSITINLNPQEILGARTTLGKFGPAVGGKTCAVAFGWDMKGSGTAGTAPSNPIDDAMAACGMVGVNIASYRETYNLSNTITTITAQLIEGAVVGGTGKSIVARGIRGNLVWTLEPGMKGTCMLEGEGVFSADADATQLLQTGEDTTKPPPLISSAMYLLEYHADNNEVVDGAVEILREGAADNLKLAITVTQGATAQKVKMIRLKLAKTLAPAAETNGVWITIEGDTAGDPDGSAITNGTSAYVATAGIPTTATWIDFVFAIQPTLDASTVYHIVIQGDYIASATDYIDVDTAVVGAGAQACQFFDAAWAALGLKNISAQILMSPNAALKNGPVEINLNNEVSVGGDPNDGQGFAEADVLDRDPIVTIAPRDTLDSEVDLAAYYDAGTVLYWACVLGSTAGNIIEFRAMHAVVTEHTPEDRDNRMTRSLMLRVNEEITGAGLELVYR